MAVSVVRRAVNTCFVERHDRTDRNRSNREVRKGYTFSKDWNTHRAATAFRYNFRGPVRTLRVKADGRWKVRTPAMVAGLTDHVWPLSEWLAYPPCNESRSPPGVR